MIQRSDDGGVALIRMEHKPANVLTTEFSDALNAEFDRVREDGSVEAVVLTGTGSAFSAGVELFRVVDDGAAYVESLLASLGVLFSKLRAFPKPVVAAVNGHAIAGGAVIACACDGNRVMSRGSRCSHRTARTPGRGPLPLGCVRHLGARRAVPQRYQREVLLLGRSYDPEAAAERGFVDEMVPPEQLIERAREIAVELTSIPAATYDLTKRQLSRAEGRAAELDDELRSIWTSAETASHIRGYLERTLGRSSAR
ncbi:enoyl-CoA hydratase/isomerase family protein [Candidatus Palauibacter sp.]|uniref:enoyl-CoA hydratase/isomerase family protein n=1 Tax=Candidatus Palauibacter sp. TaxID=3101350 RepID=UPI003B012CC0